MEQAHDTVQAIRAAALLRAEIDTVLADWAWYLDHGEFDALAGLFTPDALLVTGPVELRGRPAIRSRYAARTADRSTRHTYSGLRVTVPDGGPGPDGRPAWVRAQSTWVSFAANTPVPADDVGVYLVADFDDVLAWCADSRWRIAERRIIPVFRDPSRAPLPSQ